MKNWILNSALLMLSLTLICCNQQQKVLPLHEANENEEVTTIVFNEDNNEYRSEKEDSGNSSTDRMQEIYCVYLVQSVNDNCDFISAGQYFCVNCPAGNSCQIAGPLQTTNWELVDEDGVVICSGTWQEFGDACTTCPEDGGISGFGFL